MNLPIYYEGDLFATDPSEILSEGDEVMSEYQKAGVNSSIICFPLGGLVAYSARFFSENAQVVFEGEGCKGCFKKNQCNPEQGQTILVEHGN